MNSKISTILAYIFIVFVMPLYPFIYILEKTAEWTKVKKEYEKAYPHNLMLYTVYVKRKMGR